MGGAVFIDTPRGDWLVILSNRSSGKLRSEANLRLWETRIEKFAGIILAIDVSQEERDKSTWRSAVGNFIESTNVARGGWSQISSLAKTNFLNFYVSQGERDKGMLVTFFYTLVWLQSFTTWMASSIFHGARTRKWYARAIWSQLIDRTCLTVSRLIALPRGKYNNPFRQPDKSYFRNIALSLKYITI